MEQMPRIYHTEGQKALMWDRWKAGDSLQQIMQLFDRPLGVEGRDGDGVVFSLKSLGPPR